MARLNETTAAAEPIEILKRRFVRQNREIARVNSIQSLRIRGLESEVSHLLSENVSLREQVITLTHELERFEAAKTLRDGVYDIKSRLDSKLVELSSLVTELGSLPRQYSKATHEILEPEFESTTKRHSRKSSSINQVSSADPQPNLDFEASGRLPVILEDKYYPRRTLEAREIQQLANDVSEVPSSPVSGPPGHSAEHDDPPTTTQSDVTDTHASQDYATQEHSLPPNLETRRKKKAYSVMMGEDRTSEESISLLDSKFVRKCGAKRKFSAEDEESLFESAPAEDDGFEFTRPVHSPREPASKSDQSPAKRRPQSRVETTCIGQPKRKALEPKTTNISIASPAKPSGVSNSDKPPNLATPGGNENPHPILGKYTSPKKRIPPIYERVNAIYDNHERKTAIQIGQPPQDVDHDVPTVTDLTNTRPSRRQRAVVSYTEPNLRDKMRRSTNELGPAVGRDNSRRSSSQTEAVREQRSKDANTQRDRKSGVTSGEPDASGTLECHSQRHLNIISRRTPKTSSQALDDDVNIAREGLGPAVSLERSGEELDNHSGTGSPSVEASHNEMQMCMSMQQGTSIVVDHVALGTGKKSRRHSSIARTSGRGTTHKFPTCALDLKVEGNGLAAVHEAENSYVANDSYGDPSFLTGSREVTRGQRVAARRRSMML
ncbi:hypothetical protein BJY01DRAFT_237873 [Aspergillus pseudoustus]|uniref:Shugoshin n=1 Tax=Aspergillus pseudoustus TaxID=1810923 RepID=A0ABR4JBE9_9EURO